MADTPWGAPLAGTYYQVETGADGKALRLSRVDAAALPEALPAAVLAVAEKRVTDALQVMQAAADAADDVDAALAATLRGWTG